METAEAATTPRFNEGPPPLPPPPPPIPPINLGFEKWSWAEMPAGAEDALVGWSRGESVISGGIFLSCVIKSVMMPLPPPPKQRWKSGEVGRIKCCTAQKSSSELGKLYFTSSLPLCYPHHPHCVSYEVHNGRERVGRKKEGRLVGRKFWFLFFWNWGNRGKAEGHTHLPPSPLYTSAAAPPFHVFFTSTQSNPISTSGRPRCQHHLQDRRWKNLLPLGLSPLHCLYHFIRHVPRNGEDTEAGLRKKYWSNSIIRNTFSKNIRHWTENKKIIWKL